MSIKLIEALELSNAIDAEDHLEISINGTPYKYVSTSEFTIPELVHKVNGIRKHSAGRALQWLKKNAKGTRLNPVTESLSTESAEDIADFIMDNTSRGIIDDLNIGDKSKEILEDMYGQYVNFFTVDDTGINNDIYDSLLDINNEEKCIWYDYYVEQLYQDENEEIIKIECGDYELILTITDGFYSALNFGCTKEQLVGAIMSTQKLTEKVLSIGNEVDLVFSTNKEISKFIGTDLNGMVPKILNDAVMEYNKIENMFWDKILQCREESNRGEIKKIANDWNRCSTLKKFQNKIDEISEKMHTGYGELGRYLAAVAHRYKDFITDMVRKTKYF